MRYNLKPIHLLWIFGATLSVVLHFSDEFTNPEVTSNDWDELNKQYPGEWFYNERAYPDGIINVEAIKNAELQAKQILASRQPAGNWELKGPLNTGGRITDIALSPDSDDVFYAGAATGGIFKTTDRGVTWTPVFDEQTKLSIGDIAIAPSNANTLYVGTGEANGSVNTGAFFGDGIYKTTDAGATWTNVGLPESNHIGRIVVDPTDEDRVFVAATGKLYGYNPERGIYRTTDGGGNWEQVLHVTDSTAAIDVAMNPSNTDIIFAAMWERTRKPWIRDYGGVTSAIHRSLDGGDTWEELGAANGLPAADPQTGRIGLAVSQSDPSTIYARYTTNEITNAFNGLYKSTDNGENWTLVALSEIDFVDSFFGWYFGNIRVNPADSDQVYVLGQLLYRTDNSGSSWNEVGGMHVDHHAMEFSNNDPNFILAGNDGGIYLSENGGNTWNKFTNLPLTQFYNIEVDYSQPERLYGGTQDNNTIRTLTGGLNDWNPIWGGDGFHVNVDPVDNNFIYAEAQFGNLGRSTNGGTTFQSALDGIDFGDRNNWNTPVVISAFDNEILYYGTNRLYSSTRAVFWTAISPDLTDGPHPSGATSYGTLTAIGTSHLNLDTIYTGSDDGNVNVTFDGGSTWTNVSAGLPDRYITSIAVSPSDDLTAYVALSGYQLLDYDPHIFKTTDGGQSWTAVAGNLPNIPVNDILINSAETVLYAATDLNVWYSTDDGASWTILGDNLPLTLTRDLKLHEPTSTLYAGTYGRSMHSFDLTQVLGTEDLSNASNEVVVYPVPSTTEINIEHSLSSNGSIALYDLTGRNIKELYQGDLAQSTDTPFSIAELPQGVYFVQIRSGNKKLSRKIVKQ
ncbi:T9SS type A sorting domain-containing protein [Aureisphaera galaxeae]|uniref:VPS10 domain-containing protein n=1 Tax=Aureisphaera galaxeae TaxID=1538023 RepID=UPI00234FE52F|nr:T9SS type A sorting domain-containing protein [Aureisphaera galaxeae]MDC8004850.1 T9SS type A sorting domain-containing protein [Aureisphaera galaxeae]